MALFKLTLPRLLLMVLLTCLSVNKLFSQIIFPDIKTTGATCGVPDGTVLITPTGGMPPFTYSLGGLTQNTGYFTGLRPGVYSIIVRSATSNHYTSVIVNTKDQPVVTANVINPSGCGSNGSVALNVSGGTPPYKYGLIIDGNYQTSNIITGLPIGAYTFYVIDANGCIGTTKAVLIDNNCPMVFYAVGASTLVSCINKGNIFISGITGGTAPYQQSLDGINYQSLGIINNLEAGVYTVYIKDAAGLVKTMGFQMADGCRPDFIYVTTVANCQQHDGVITITNPIGTPPFSYSIDGINYQPGNVFGGLASGSYTITMKDDFNRTVSKVVAVNDNCPQLSLTATGETCRGNDGTITATVTKGTAPFEYSTDGVNYQANPVFSVLPAGDYTITVKDALGFTGTATVKVNNVCIDVSSVATNSTCGNSNGGIVVAAARGTIPYEYSIDGINFQAGNSFSGLAAGPYTVWAKDAAGKINSTAITINNTAGPQINATATPALCTDKEGTVSISGTGGTTPYLFSIDGTNYQKNGTFNNRASGNYTAWIKDANGCTASQPVVVLVTDNLTFTPGNNPTICEGDTTVFTCTSNGNSFNWSPALGLRNASTLNPAATPGITTKYYVTASLGVCTKKDSVTVFVNPAPLADAGNGTTICYGQSAQLNGAGGISYNWSPATYLSNAAIADPEVVRPSSTMTYSLKVTDATGCTSIQPAKVTITVTPPAKVFAGNDTAIVMNQPFVLQAVDINNSRFTQYQWSPAYGLSNSAVQNPVALLNENITYTVTATTPQGCSGMDAINIKVYRGPEIYVPNAFSPNGDGRNELLKAIPVGIKEFKYFNVYNRWGQLIFSTKDASKGWNGEVNHQQQGTGAFVWMAEGVDGKGNVIRRRGTVTLIR